MLLEKAKFMIILKAEASGLVKGSEVVNRADWELVSNGVVGLGRERSFSFFSFFYNHQIVNFKSKFYGMWIAPQHVND